MKRQEVLQIVLAKMRRGLLVSIDFDDSMANNFSQAFFSEIETPF